MHAAAVVLVLLAFVLCPTTKKCFGPQAKRVSLVKMKLDCCGLNSCLHGRQGLMDTWLSRESKHAEASQGGRAALNKLNSIKARLRNARSEVYCTLQVPVPSTCIALT